MPDSSELLQQIQHCQKSLTRYSQNANDSKMLYYILKLFKMPITVSHLEDTGIGRTVNSLRKLQGEAGDAARTLVAKWKEMVSENEECEESECSNTNGREESNNGHYKIEEKRKDTDSSHKHSDKLKVNGMRDKHSRDNKHKSSGESERSSSERRHKSPSNSHRKSSSNSKEKYHKSPESEYSPVENSSSDSDSQSSTNEESDSSSASDKQSKHKHIDKKSSQKSSKSQEKDYKENRKSHSSHSESDKKHKHHSRSSSERKHNDSSTTKDSSNKRKRDKSPSDDDSDRKKSKKSSSHSSHRSSNSGRSSESSQNSNGNREYKESHDHKKDTKHTLDKKESRSSSSSNAKGDIKPEKKKHDSHKEDHQRIDDKSKKDCVKSEKTSSSSSKDNKDKSSKSSKHSSKTNSNVKKTPDLVDIGSESGTSFADALGMLEPPKPTTNKSSKKPVTQKPLESSHKTEKMEKSEKKERSEKKEKSEKKEEYSKEKPSKSDKIEVVIPPPPTQKMDIDISSLLPSITPNYRPVTNLFADSANARNKMMNEDEALNMVMSQKNMRTKVYSGNKSLFGNVPTLFELCIRVLQDNIDALEYTGGVPYSILKPILDKATPDQLFMLEHHNPYIIEDTDNLWQFHCSKEFRNKKRMELESWREMYMRCLDEREAKLKALTENIKLAQDKSTPVRQTKLAYVDSVVKPPRDVLRKQAKHGIDKKPIVTPTARLNSIVAAGTAGQVAVPNHVRASSSGTSSSASAAKQKKAPLMQKTLAFLKGNRFRR